MNEKPLTIRIGSDGFICKYYTPHGEVSYVDLKDLEAILQAVKKTQAKLVNKQIQEIQDSKNTNNHIMKILMNFCGENGENEGMAECLERKMKEMVQNQKIVDELIRHYRNSHSSDGELREFVERIIKSATGKDIKDL